MSLTIWLLAFVLLAVLGWCVYWHRKENAALIKHWLDTQETTEAKTLSKFAWGRSFQLFAAVGTLVVAVLLFGWKIDALRKQIEDYHAAQILPSAPVIANQPPEERKPLPDAIANPVVLVQPSIVDIFTPSLSPGDKLAVIDNLKQQYENTIVLYFIMARCEFTLATDYDWIMASLRKDMRAANAPAELQTQILNAAKGSYQELYAYNKCATPEIQKLASQFREYINSLYQMDFSK